MDDEVLAAQLQTPDDLPKIPADRVRIVNSLVGGYDSQAEKLYGNAVFLLALVPEERRAMAYFRLGEVIDAAGALGYHDNWLDLDDFGLPSPSGLTRVPA